MQQEDKLMEVCLLAGRILIESGSEMYRVEDTMKHIADCGDVVSSAAFTSLTGVLASFQKAPYTRFMQIDHRGIDMHRISQVNTLSRAFEHQEISLDTFHKKLLVILKEPKLFSLLVQTLGAGLESACLMIIFTQLYDWWDFPAAFILGALGYWLSIIVNQRLRIRFMGELLGAFVIAITAIVLVQHDLGQNLNNIIIGAVMPLVPGVPMTNALRDLIEGNILAGTERGVESLGVVGAIAVGVGISFYLCL
ncbi:threonine/serine exporter family protein [Bombilactobacillus thymidiniphilus]|uniref:Threonine/serine exporter family protein n=1 Tax=Bombilactobacillus thymidiniphilus TaxID=2923363 RepID=A0ABY4PFZ1_9LACO|nr:threonine/serine exporter family protein [Bombilactobacillus thymidiniphilus]UQS84237.1 threonine/serine exporter family protein [Bombilactobacillus thymidiniphilus]